MLLLLKIAVGIELLDFLGFVAAVLTLSAFIQTIMVRIRMTAVGANTFFIC